MNIETKTINNIHYIKKDNDIFYINELNKLQKCHPDSSIILKWNDCHEAETGQFCEGGGSGSGAGGSYSPMKERSGYVNAGTFPAHKTKEQEEKEKNENVQSMSDDQIVSGSGGGGNGGRSVSGGSGDAGQPGEVVRAVNAEQAAKSLLNDATFDATAVTRAIKDGTLSRSALSMHIDHTKYGIDQAIKAIDSKLATRGNMKASDVRKQPEFQKIVAYRDRLKGQVRDMFDAMKATSNVKQFK